MIDFLLIKKTQTSAQPPWQAPRPVAFRR